MVLCDQNHEAKRHNSIHYCTVLCCAVLCCAVLCCAVLCCAVLSCAVHYFVLLSALVCAVPFWVSLVEQRKEVIQKDSLVDFTAWLLPGRLALEKGSFR